MREGGGRECEREGGREGGRERGREGGREEGGRKEGGRGGRKEGGRECGREGGREGGRKERRKEEEREGEIDKYGPPGIKPAGTNQRCMIGNWNGKLYIMDVNTAHYARIPLCQKFGAGQAIAYVMVYHKLAHYNQMIR